MPVSNHGTHVAGITGARGDNGKMVAGVNWDVTARRAGEEAVRAQLEELKRWQSLNLAREDRVLELKHEVNDLLEQAQQPRRYGCAQ